jgi:hypothetical protein
MLEGMTGYNRQEVWVYTVKIEAWGNILHTAT